MTKSFPINFFNANRTPAVIRSAIEAKRKELSAIDEKMRGIENARTQRKEQLERLLSELALSETTAPAPTQLCPA